jgi:hypothetical protein
MTGNVIHQDVMVRAWISCAVPNCAQAFHVDEQVPDNAVRYTDATIGYSRQLSEAALRDGAKAAGWVVGPDEIVCPVHVRLAIYELVTRVREQAQRITDAHSEATA